MSEYLLNKRPILFNPEVAEVIGLNQAIVLQQINYWINKPFAKEIDGKRWIYNSIDQWQKDNFPFWSERTIRRILKKLEDEELIISGRFNKATYDQTKWYTINEERLEAVMRRDVQNEPDNKDASCVQNDRIRCGQNGRLKSGKMDEPIPETTRDYSESTSVDYLSKEKGQDSHERKDDLSSKDDLRDERINKQTQLLVNKIISMLVSIYQDIHGNEKTFKSIVVSSREKNKLVPVAEKLLQARFSIEQIRRQIVISMLEAKTYPFGHMLSSLDNFAEQELRRQQNES